MVRDTLFCKNQLQGFLNNYVTDIYTYTTFSFSYIGIYRSSLCSYGVTEKRGGTRNIDKW